MSTSPSASSSSSPSSTDLPTLIQVKSNILPPRQLYIVFSSLAFSLLISFIDQNGISVALPRIGKDLGASDSIVWAGTSALIANTCFQVLYGRLSDILGRRAVMLASIALLALGDLLCGFAKTGPQLYAFRGIAGVGNGGIAALAMIIVSDTCTLEERGKYQGILGACVGLGNATGPFIAAAVIERLTWRIFFWICCGLSVFSGILVALLVPPSVITGSAKEKMLAIDYAGIVLSATGVILLLIPISGGGINFPWNSPMVISMLVLGSVSMVIFLWSEAHWARMPLLPLRLFRDPPVSAILIQNVFIGIVYYSMLYFVPIYFQTARHWSPLRAATLILPFVVCQTVLSVGSGFYLTATKRYLEVIWLGYGMLTLGCGLQIIFDLSTPIWAIVLILSVTGSGIGLVFQPTLVAAQALTSKDDRAVVVSARNFTRAVGGAGGLAMSTVIYISKVKNGVASLPAHLRSQITDEVLSPPAISSMTSREAQTVFQSYASGTRVLAIIWVVFMGACVGLCLFIKDRGLSRPENIEEAGKFDPVAQELPVAGVVAISEKSTPLVSTKTTR